jgi:hypothetical protein
MTVALQNDITELGMDQGDLVRFLQNVRDSVNEMRTGLGTALQGNYLLSTPGLAGGSNADDVANIAFSFSIGGVVYNKAAITTGTGPGNDVVPEDLYGACAFDIGADGTVDAVEATDNATGYASAALAAAGLPAAAAGHARMGYVTATKSDGAFTFGTTNLNAANTTVAFTEGTSLFDAVSAALTQSALTLAKG